MKREYGGGDQRRGGIEEAADDQEQERGRGGVNQQVREAKTGSLRAPKAVVEPKCDDECFEPTACSYSVLFC